MATSRSSSAAARLSRSAANVFRSSGSGQSMCIDLASAIVRPRALISPNESKISTPSSLSTSLLNRVASRSALARSYSTTASTGQIPGAQVAKRVESSPKWASMVVSVQNNTLWHMNRGVEEILADYVHQEATRTLMLVGFRLFLIITVKDVFLALAHL